MSNDLISDTTIANNESTYDGGGVGTLGTGNLSFKYSAIAGNQADIPVAKTGDGYGGGGISSEAPLYLKNTIVAGNTVSSSGVDPDLRGPLVTAAFSLIGDTTGASITTTGPNITGESAVLGPLQDNGGPTETMAPLFGSPAIDAGSGMGTDQRGLPRPVDLPSIANAAGGDGSDIGAVELQTAPTPPGGPPPPPASTATGERAAALKKCKKKKRASRKKCKKKAKKLPV